MSKMKKNRKKLFAILLQAALVSTAMTMPAYAAKTPGIGSDALVGDDATGPVLTGGNTEVEEETSPYTKEQLEDGTLEYGEIAWRIEGYNSTYLNLRSQLYSQTTSQSAGTALAAEASALMEDAMDLKSDDMDAETRELFEGYKAAARELRKQGPPAVPPHHCKIPQNVVSVSLPVFCHRCSCHFLFLFFLSLSISDNITLK